MKISKSTKGIFMRKLVLILLAISSIAQAAPQGNDQGSGGFSSYYYVLGKPISWWTGIADIAHSSLTREEFNNFISKYTTPNENSYDLFLNALNNIKSMPLENRVRKNPDGYNERLMMDYDLETNSLYALQPFFEKFGITQHKDDDVELLYYVIYHEASHLIGIGLTRDQDSYEFSREFYKFVLNKHVYGNCGVKGNWEAREKSCTKYSKSDLNKSEQLVLNTVFRHTKDDQRDTSIYFKNRLDNKTWYVTTQKGASKAINDEDSKTQAISRCNFELENKHFRLPTLNEIQSLRQNTNASDFLISLTYRIPKKWAIEDGTLGFMWQVYAYDLSKMHVSDPGIYFNGWEATPLYKKPTGVFKSVKKMFSTPHEISFLFCVAD